jgi:hypothetical protein
VCDIDELSQALKGLGAKYGKYAVLGNHEFYAGLDNSLCFIRESGFTLLRSEWEIIGDIITIAGVDDPAGRIRNQTIDVPEKQFLSPLPRERFTVLLKHQPKVDRQAAGLFDLQLSGHAHNGQIFPFTLFTRLFYPVKPGVLNQFNGSLLYMSRGTGTWGPPARFLSPPEITVFELSNQ